MSSKRVTEETFKDINAAIAAKIFKTKEGRTNCKINFGTNMFTANKQRLNWARNMGNADSGFLAN